MTNNNKEKRLTKIPNALKSKLLACSLSFFALAGGTYNANGQNKDSSDSKVIECTTNKVTDEHMEKCGAKEYLVKISIERVKVKEGKEWITYSKASNIFEFGNGFSVEREIYKVNDNGEMQSETSCILRAPDGREYDLSFLSSTDKDQEKRIQEIENECEGARKAIDLYGRIHRTSPLNLEVVGDAKVTGEINISRIKGGSNNVPQQIKNYINDIKGRV